MADGLVLNSGSGGDTINADDIAGTKVPGGKLVLGADGANDGYVSSSNPLPVTGTVAVTGVATAANQSTGNTSLASIDTKTPALGQALAAGSVPVVLPAAQITTLTPPAAITGFLTESDFDSKVGSLTETAPATDTASSGLNGRLQRIAQRLTSLIALLPAALGQTTKSGSLPVTIASDQDALAVTGTFWQATQPVSAASLPLPSGAATSAKQPAIGTAGSASSDVLTVQGIASMTPLKVDGSAVTQPVSGTFWQATQPVSLASVPSHAVTNAGTFAVQVSSALPAGTNAIGKLAANSGVDIGDVDVTSVTPGTGATSLGKAEDAAHTTGDTGVFVLAVRNSAGTNMTNSNGDYSPFSVDAAGDVYVTSRSGLPITDNSGSLTVDLPAVASGGATPLKVISAASTNATSVKGSAGTLYALVVTNTNAAARYLKLYNKASAPTVGTDTPVLTLAIPGNAAGAGVVFPIPSQGIAFGTGIALALTTGAADSDTGAVAANEIIVAGAYA